MGELVVSELLIALGLNLLAATLLVFGIYFRRHRRRDLVLGYLAFNTCLFAVAAALGSSSPLNVGVGFGLFAVLSIVRLRSDEASQAEIGYTMVALVLGLLNGLPGLQFEIKLLFTVLLVGTMYIADHPAVLPAGRHVRFKVEIDVALSDPDEIERELERRLGYALRRFTVQEVDFVRETMRIDVRADVTRPVRKLEGVPA
ncbi:MAG: DUF4956 domain-containing protein [Nitriliruptoraceae bacterium]|nr:DUF4956 domain-containing protein [Nitriliruptoraceae bacterium]